jgi:hypothetical protein
LTVEINNIATMDDHFDAMIETRSLSPIVVCEVDADGNLDNVHRVPNQTYAATLPFTLPTLAFRDGNWYSVRQSPEQHEIDDEIRCMVRAREAGIAAIELQGNQSILDTQRSDGAQEVVADLSERVRCQECRDVEARNAERAVVHNFWRKWFNWLVVKWRNEYDYTLNPATSGDDPTSAAVCTSCRIPKDEAIPPPPKDEQIPRLPEWFFQAPAKRDPLQHFFRYGRANQNWRSKFCRRWMEQEEVRRIEATKALEAREAEELEPQEVERMRLQLTLELLGDRWFRREVLGLAADRPRRAG